MKTLIRCLLISILSMMIFVSCKQTDDISGSYNDKKTVLDLNVLNGYSIVRSDYADSTLNPTLVRAAVNLRDGLCEIFDITLTTDFVKRGQEVPATGLEILVGLTNRPESIAMYEKLRINDFAIGRDGDRIMIIGGSDEATFEAVEYYLANFVDIEKKEISLPEKTYIHTAEYMFDSLLINDHPITEYTVCVDENQPFSTLYDAVSEFKTCVRRVMGIELNSEKTIVEERGIIFRYSDVPQDTCTISVEDSNIYVSAADADGILCAQKYLLHEFFGMDGLERNEESKNRSIHLQDIQTLDLTEVSFANPSSIYVSPYGLSNGDGSRENPVSTIQEAFVLLHITNLAPCEIVLLDGDYYLTESITITAAEAGTKYTPLTIRAENPGGARLCGAIKADLSLLQPVKDGEILERVIDKEAAENLMMLDISFLTEDKLSKPSDDNPMQIYYGTQALTPARYPNEEDGYLQMKRVIDDSETSIYYTYKDTENHVAQYWTDKTLQDTHIFYYNAGGANTPLKVTLKKEKMEMYIERSAESEPRPNNRFYFFNMPEEIDRPGESYIDLENKIVYFLPYDEKADEILITLMDTPIIRMENCSNITIEGIQFMYLRRAAITASNVQNIAINACEISHSYYNAYNLQGTHITVDGYEIPSVVLYVD